MRKTLAALLITLGLTSAALAQNFNMPPPAGVTVGGFVVVSSCGGQTLTVGKPAFATMDTTGKLCDSATGGGGTTSSNITQFGGTNISTGTGVGGAGIPRVTVSSDSFPATQPASIANGSDVAEGTTTDSPATTPTTAAAATSIALLKALNNSVIAPIPAGTNQIGHVIVDTAPSTAVTNAGTFAVQATIPPSSSASVGITPVVSAAAEASHVLKASAGNAYSAYAVNLTATAGFLVLLNSTTAPADGAITPLACAPLAPNGIASLSYAPGPPGVFSTGITVVVTSAASCFTKTTGVITAFLSGSVQ